MIYKSITIKNLKGIKRVTIDFTNNRIITLVGLNESGKTTILEGMYLFYRLVKGEKLKNSDYNEFRPKGIGFSDSIEISAELEFEDNDYKKIQKYAKKEGHRTKVKFPEKFNYTYLFNYELHKYIDTKTMCLFDAKSAAAKEKLFKSNNDLWNKLIRFIKVNLIPDILYYEDFVFEIPNEIPYTFTDEDEDDIEDEELLEWKLVLDDILKSIEPKFKSFQENVVDIWHSDNDLARQIISAMERQLDNVITKAWQELFKATNGNKGSKRLNFKEIKIVSNPVNEGINISFKVKSESGKEFSINERSKGFKWFFSFLIFTEFRKNRTNNILFLLDEPASNLHSSAQIKILEAIDDLSDKSMIVYSTHSHHLINPLWLNGAYVVENEAISTENLEGALTDTEAKINVSKYYNFVNKSKDVSQSIFFQPILDRLEYSPSSLELKPHITICEGKFDWYTFQYLSKIIMEDDFEYNFYPGTGKDDLGDIIRLYLSWGCDFTVVIDGDKPAQKAKDNYLKEFLEVLDGRIFTYKDILDLECPTEDLFTENDRKLICDTAFGKGTFDNVKSNKKAVKSKFNFAVIQLLTKSLKVKLEKSTMNNFNLVFELIKKRKTCS
jgi:predicted ATP-dependent endonuclease of OLD family